MLMTDSNNFCQQIEVRVRDCVSISVPHDSGDLTLNGNTCARTTLKIIARQAKHSGRSNELPQSDHSNQMVSFISSIQGDLQNLCKAQGGSHCHAEKP